jgi:hypothetical protein
LASPLYVAVIVKLPEVAIDAPVKVACRAEKDVTVGESEVKVTVPGKV